MLVVVVVLGVLLRGGLHHGVGRYCVCGFRSGQLPNISLCVPLVQGTWPLLSKGSLGGTGVGVGRLGISLGGDGVRYNSSL